MPKIVCICGSSRFCRTMAVIAWLIERDEGKIALGLHLLPAWYTSLKDHQAEAEGVSDHMDALHLRKIDLADEVFVVDGHGYEGETPYIGESTRAEIARAESQGKPIRYFSQNLQHFRDACCATSRG